MSEQGQEAVSADPTANGRTTWAAMVLSGDPGAMEALVAGLAVPRSRLNPSALEALGEPVDGPAVTLDDALTLRLEVALPGTGEQAETKPSWQPVSIAEAAAEPIREPERMSGLVYDDALTLVSGEPGVGKSMFLAAAVASEAIENRTALYLDFEGVPGTLLERLEAAGLSAEQIARVLYLRPSVQASPDEIRTMIGWFAPALVALDSYDAALAAFGLETKNEDIRAFHGLVMEPLRSSGAPVLVADHVAKNREQRGPYSIGGQSKLALADAHLGLVPITPLRRGAGGKLKVKAHKDRHGWLPRTAIFDLTSHETTGALSWTVNVEDEPGDADGWRPTVLMDRASRYLEMQSGEVSQRQVERDVTGNGAALRTALNRLVEDGYVEASEGPRGARMLRSAKPYREADE